MSSVVTVVVAFLVAFLVDRAFLGRERRAAASSRGLSPAAETRLRVLRRFLVVSIVILGALLAASKFLYVQRFLIGLLASSTVIGLVVGYAARQTLANVVGGVWLLLTQTVRVGDQIAYRSEPGASASELGTVEDLRLTYTLIACSDGSRMIVPNERLSAATVVNHTLMDPGGVAKIAVWVPPTGDHGEMVRRLGAVAADVGGARSPERETNVAVGEIATDGVRLDVTVKISDARLAPETESELRIRCLEALDGLNAG